MQLIAYEGSSSASTGYNYYYIVDNGKLKCVQGIVYDSDADSENPNYQVYEDSFSIEGGEPVSEEYAREITETYAKQYRKVPYRPISEGYEFLTERRPQAASQRCSIKQNKRRAGTARTQRLWTSCKT